MISVNNDFGLDRLPDGIEEEPRSEPRVSEVDVIVETSSDETPSGGSSRKASVDMIGSEEFGILQGVVFDNSDKVTDGGGEKETSSGSVGSGGIRVSAENENRAQGSDLGVRVSDGDDDIENSEQSGSWNKVDTVHSRGKGFIEVNSGVSDHKFDAWNGEMEHSGSRFRKGYVQVGKSNVSQYDSMLSVVDEFAAKGRGKAVRAGPSTPQGFGYEIGDMVWGKVKSHPWWPGHIYNEASASSSVRRTKRAGHLLVAFFGDSSYGWFDQAEVIPFDPNFAEKSRQTNSRSFVKAVEEAVDEASRRCGLGLACRCRNKYNFRPTNVQGYFSVDVVDYEPGAVYSANQIRKARDCFQPRKTLAFIKNLALMPAVDQPLSIDFIKNKATVFSYRKAVFEEYDETYAQAFGAQPVRPSHELKDAAAHPFEEPSRAPRSGPQVIAEALGKVNISTKPNKAKDQEKKDSYLFKRRDERDELETHQINLGLASSSFQPTNGEGSSALPAENYIQPTIAEGSSTLAAGNCVLQKRVPLISRKSQIRATNERTRTISRDGTSALHTDVTCKGIATLQEKSAVVKYSMTGSQVNASKVESSASPDASFPVGESETPAYSSSLLEAKSSLDNGKGTRLEMVERRGSIVTTGPASVGASSFSGKAEFPGIVDSLSCTSEPEAERTIDFKHDPENSEKIKMDEGYQQSPSLPTTVKESHGQKQVHDGHKGAKKGKALKRTTRELSSEKSAPGEEKKKKRKKELDTEMSSGHMQKRAATEKSGALVGKVAGKSVQVGWAHVEDFQVDCQKKVERASSLMLPDSARMQPVVRTVNFELELLQLLGGLQSLALNPFHGVERNNTAFIQQVVLRFRSLVYQQSSVMLPEPETQSNEAHAAKYPASNAVSGDPQGKNISNLPSLKPPKPLDKPDDLTKGGWKRGPSDRLEEMAAKRLKKISDLKTLAAEKKGAQKTEEAPQGTGKERVAPTPTKPVKADSTKKMEPPAKASSPTTLVMKFPPHTNLPSGSELKARLARFGALDHSGTRIFYKSSTCRVVFLRKLDAEAALKHLSGNNSLFGNVNIRCHLREVAATEDTCVENPQSVAAPAHQPRQQPAVQLKSILKKSGGDETAPITAGNGNGGSKGTPRVKFMLGGEESSRSEQLMVANKNNNASFPDGASSSSSHAMDFNSKNFQNVVPPPPLSSSSSASHVVHLPSAQFAKAQNNLHYAPDVVPGSAYNFNTPTSLAVNVAAPIAAANIDIAQQMISLLTRCNDVVTNVKGFLGYVPYHPL